MTLWTQLPKPIIALAPMAGVTDSAFRQICHQWGADVTFTPLLASEGLVRQQRKSLAMLKIYPEEGPVVVQLFGKNPSYMAQAAIMAQQAGAAGVDLNLGCPARKIVKQGIGVALAEDLDLCHQILAAMCGAVTIPVSLKIRAWARCHTRPGKVEGDEIVKRMSDLPLSAITVHGRGTDNPFGSEVNLSLIKTVKELHHGITLANGGIVDGLSAKRALDVTDADGVMVGRGVLGKPWIFTAIKNYLAGQDFTPPTMEEIKSIMIKHARLTYERNGEHGIISGRKHWLWYTKSWPNAGELRQHLSQAKNIKDIQTTILA